MIYKFPNTSRFINGIVCRIQHLRKVETLWLSRRRGYTLRQLGSDCLRPDMSLPQQTLPPGGHRPLQRHVFIFGKKLFPQGGDLPAVGSVLERQHLPLEDELLRAHHAVAGNGELEVERRRRSSGEVHWGPGGGGGRLDEVVGKGDPVVHQRHGGEVVGGGAIVQVTFFTIADRSSLCAYMAIYIYIFSNVGDKF